MSEIAGNFEEVNVKIEVSFSKVEIRAEQSKKKGLKKYKSQI